MIILRMAIIRIVIRVFYNDFKQCITSTIYNIANTIYRKDMLASL
jgi:hypothetical protein